MQILDFLPDKNQKLLDLKKHKTFKNFLQILAKKRLRYFLAGTVG